MKRCGVLLLCAALLMLAGCGSGGGDGDDDDAEQPLSAPDYDLTGCWEIREVPKCNAEVEPLADLSDSQLTYVNPVTDAVLDGLESDELGHLDLLRQDDNGLHLIDTASGERIAGTISEDQVRFAARMVDEWLGFEATWEAQGTVLSRDIVALTETTVLRSEEAAGEVVCQVRMERAVDAPASCIIEPDGEAGQ